MRRGRKKGGKNGDDKGALAHDDFWGRQNCSPSRAPMTHSTPLMAGANNYDCNWHIY